MNKTQSHLRDNKLYGGGVSSWNDLMDKPFEEKIGRVTLLPEQEIGIAGRDYKRIWPFETLLLGEVYTVTVDDVDYEIECTFDDKYGEQHQLIVNDYLEIYQRVGDDGLNISNGLSEPVNYVLSIVGPGKVVTPLDEKYIPDSYADKVVAKVIEALPTWTGGEY